MKDVSVKYVDRAPIVLDDLRHIDPEDDSVMAGGQVGCWIVNVGGTMFLASYDLSSHSVMMAAEAARDLVSYVNDFVFHGCGGSEHEFDGDPKDPLQSMDCLKCGAVKKLGMIHDQEELRQRLQDRVGVPV
jgi:hypothetical protein